MHETVFTLDLLESGRVTPTDEEIQRICEVLSVSKEEFLRDDETTKSATTEVTAERNSGENYVFKFEEMQIYELRRTISGRATLFWGVTWGIFENRLRYDGEWRLYSESDLGGLHGIYSEGKQYTYYIVYNVSQKNYNSWPSRNGTFSYINVLYNKETNSMRIVEYVLIYGN